MYVFARLISRFCFLRNKHSPCPSPPPSNRFAKWLVGGLLIQFLGIIHLVRRQIFLKNYYFLPPDMHTFVCVSGGKKCQFFGKFCVRTKWMIPCLLIQFSSQLLQHNVDRLTNLIRSIIATGEFIQSLFTWKYKSRSLFAFLVSSSSLIHTYVLHY